VRPNTLSLPHYYQKYDTNNDPGRSGLVNKGKQEPERKFKSVFGVFFYGTGAWGALRIHFNVFISIFFSNAACIYGTMECFTMHALFTSRSTSTYREKYLLTICISCTAVFCRFIPVAAGPQARLSKSGTASSLRHPTAANPRPRLVPLSKRGFFLTRDSHELLVFF
jgi:hypothetical protein